MIELGRSEAIQQAAAAGPDIARLSRWVVHRILCARGAWWSGSPPAAHSASVLLRAAAGETGDADVGAVVGGDGVGGVKPCAPRGLMLSTHTGQTKVEKTGMIK